MMPLCPRARVGRIFDEETGAVIMFEGEVARPDRIEGREAHADDPIEQKGLIC